ncbi:sodium/hydrogen exchanger 2-like [Lampetra fluviatilis]
MNPERMEDVRKLVEQHFYRTRQRLTSYNRHTLPADLMEKQAGEILLRRRKFNDLKRRFNSERPKRGELQHQLSVPTEAAHGHKLNRAKTVGYYVDETEEGDEEVATPATPRDPRDPRDDPGTPGDEDVFTPGDVTAGSPPGFPNNGPPQKPRGPRLGSEPGPPRPGPSFEEEEEEEEDDGGGGGGGTSQPFLKKNA